MGNTNSTKNDTTTNSRFCEEFVEIVQLILDGEASEEHKSRFHNYFMECGHCSSYFNLESSTVEFLKKKITQEKTPVPKDLEREIRSKIQYLA